MTESQWLACEDPGQMLEFIRSKVKDRKLRLFFVATARSVWSLIERADMRLAVEAGELYADGLLTKDELRRHDMYSYVANPTPDQRNWIRDAIFRGSDEKLGALKLALLCVFSETGLTNIPDVHAYRDARKITERFQPPLLRDIFGNPFRPVLFSPSWRTSTAVALATQMYESRDFSVMPILADALQAAGCENEDILSHCRGPGLHVRGCWVVDLVLGKE